MTARQVLYLSGSFFIQDRGRLERRTEEMLDLVGLSAKADRKVGGFSGGETQRLGIAQAQIHDPQVLIFDEPAAALDPMGREQVLAIMEQLRERSTIFFSTHILDDVQRISDRVAILNQGRLIAQASTAELLSHKDGIAYRLVTRGQPERIRHRLDDLQWINHVEMKNNSSAVDWRIFTNHETKAEQDLLRAVLADEGVRVLEFGRERVELEQVFMQLVNGDR
jgi:ABC-2 type transport system ATP-binding protein